jgi:glycosyltransferase involved in cell wall biosynthesis
VSKAAIAALGGCAIGSAERSLDMPASSVLRIAVSAFGTDGGQSGIGRYLRALLEDFSRLDGRQGHLELLVARADRDSFPGTHDARAYPDIIAKPLASLLWHGSALPVLSHRKDYDVLFLPAANRRLVPWAACPSVGTVHDFAALHVTGKYDPARHFYIRHILPALVRRLTRIIAVSESGKRDILEHTGVDEQRVTVVPNGVDLDKFRPQDSEESRSRVRRELGLSLPYLLYVSRLEHPGKNHVRLIQAFARLKRDRSLPHQLVLAGPDWTRAEAIHEAVALSGVAGDIRLPGYVPGDLLPALYTAADLVVFPSLYEGFGLPILEAMACGTPVACSNVSSMPEVGGEAAAYFDPTEIESMGETIRCRLDDDQLRGSMRTLGLERSRRFTWKRCAERTMSVLGDVVREAA